MGLRHVISGIFLWLVPSGADAKPEDKVEIFVVGHGWHTGLVIPLSEVAKGKCPALREFDGWEYAEIGWGDEGFYRGGDSIPLGKVFAAVVTPTPTVLHVVGINGPVEETFQTSGVIRIDVEREGFAEMMGFIASTFRIEKGAPIGLGEGIYGFSRFFRAEGSYYFPNTCNVWTLKVLKAAGIPVIPALGVRTENVMDQSAEFGTTIRRHPGRSRISVLVGTAIAGLVVWRLGNVKRLALWAWGFLVGAAFAGAAFAMMAVNGYPIPGWIPGGAAFACWLALGFVLFAHLDAMRKRFRLRHVPPAVLALLLVLIGLSPL